MSKLTTLLDRKNSILSLFKEKFQELTELSTEINSEIENNNKQIAELNADNANLGKLKAETDRSAKQLSKILG